LIGEDNTGTIINGGNLGKTILIASDNVGISRFTIQEGDYGIYSEESNVISIENNIISGASEYAISFTSGDSIRILNNTIDDSGIYLSGSVIDELEVANSTIITHNSIINEYHIIDSSELVYQIFLSIMVLDVNGEPVKDALVFIYDAENNLISVLITDEFGWISSIPITVSIQNSTSIFSLLPYRIEVEKESYETNVQIMNISQDNTLGISLKEKEALVKIPVSSFPWAVAIFGGIVGTFAVFGVSFILIEIFKFGLISLFIPLFSRIKSEDILNQPIRERIYGYIIGNPGVNYGMIKQDLGLANGQLIYHLRQLDNAHLIYSKKDGIKKRFYPVEFPKPKTPIHYFTETQNKILKVLKKASGITQKELAKTIGISRQVAYYHLSKLEQKGLIRKEVFGTQSRYYVVKQPS
jgi:DNA-binding MarR family transcriptional regulator